MGTVGLSVAGHRIEPLGSQTWDAFADLAERHNGVWGGCWCASFHCYPDPPERRQLGNREFKHQLVEQAGERSDEVTGSVWTTPMAVNPVAPASLSLIPPR